MYFLFNLQFFRIYFRYITLKIFQLANIFMRFNNSKFMIYALTFPPNFFNFIPLRIIFSNFFKNIIDSFIYTIYSIAGINPVNFYILLRTVNFFLNCSIYTFTYIGK